MPRSPLSRTTFLARVTLFEWMSTHKPRVTFRSDRFIHTSTLLTVVSFIPPDAPVTAKCAASLPTNRFFTMYELVSWFPCRPSCPFESNSDDTTQIRSPSTLRAGGRVVAEGVVVEQEVVGLAVNGAQPRRARRVALDPDARARSSRWAWLMYIARGAGADLDAVPVGVRAEIQVSSADVEVELAGGDRGPGSRPGSWERRRRRSGPAVPRTGSRCRPDPTATCGCSSPSSCRAATRRRPATQPVTTSLAAHPKRSRRARASMVNALPYQVTDSR